LLQAEVRLDCTSPGETYLNSDPSIAFFEIALGEVYIKHARTFSAQMLPGRFEKVRLWFTMDENPTMVQFTMLGGKGAKATVRNLEVHEVKDVPPRPGFAP
jgi:hypothetical protein